MQSGHTLVQVFGRRRSAIEQFNSQNERLYRASFRAQFLSGIIQPAMQFLSNLNYVGVAVIGGCRAGGGGPGLRGGGALLASFPPVPIAPPPDAPPHSSPPPPPP